MDCIALSICVTTPLMLLVIDFIVTAVWTFEATASTRDDSRR